MTGNREHNQPDAKLAEKVAATPNSRGFHRFPNKLNKTGSFAPSIVRHVPAYS